MLPGVPRLKVFTSHQQSVLPVTMHAFVSPTHFTALVLDGLSVEEALEHYLDWIEGTGAHSKRRRTRRNQGVPSPIDRVALLDGVPVHGDRGCEVAARRDDRQVLLRFIHRDTEIPDVCWYSVVRLRVDSDECRAVSIEHATGRAIPPHMRLPPVAGAPSVLRELCQLQGVRPRSRDLITQRAMSVAPGEADAFVRYVLLDRARSIPYVIVSGTNATGAFLAEPDTVAQRLATQAIVASLHQDATREFADAFEACGYDRQFGVCFDGAVRLYQTTIDRSNNPREHYLWLPDRLRDHGQRATDALAGEIAERVTWRALPPRFFVIVDDFDRARSHYLAEQALKREAHDSKDHAHKLKEFEAMVHMLREQLQAAQDERALWKEEASSLESSAVEWRKIIEIAEQERDEAKSERAVAQLRINALEARAAGLTSLQLEVLQSKLHRNRIDSLSQALVLLETAFPNRVRVLTSAWKSAEEAEEFKKPDKAWGLMLQLVTDYWEAIQKGGGAAAKDVFTDATYGARESGPVEEREGARRLRTFDYNGREITMWEHLKIGVKDSIAETWRMHFFFDADEKKIVIGHCGKHLDFK